MEDINLEKIQSEAEQAVRKAKDVKTLEKLRVRYLGRKNGEITKVIKMIPNLSLAEKTKIGPAINALKQAVEKLLENQLETLKSESKTVDSSALDVTMPGKKVLFGHLHPLSIIEKEIREIFKAMHFSVIEGPEVESDYYNFDVLNIPKNHPARDLWDTFWLEQSRVAGLFESGRLLLRTHTSPMQVRYMEKHKPPFQIIVPGRVFRYEATDASHEINFYQVEGLMAGKNVSLANFKFVIQEFFKRLFKKDVDIRLRPSYFPFVEPGLEVDVECVRCNGSGLIPQNGTVDRAKRGSGCAICKETGWLEVMGAGMVHPKVFEAAHYDPREVSGFAFGLGLERIAMIKYNIPDIRLFYSGDLRFIKQF